jgi:hypothetical protein
MQTCLCQRSQRGAKAPPLYHRTFQQLCNSMQPLSVSAVRKEPTCGDMEDELLLFSVRADRDRSACSQLRNRYQLLHMTRGMLRSESLYRAELSDFMSVHGQPKGHSPDVRYGKSNCYKKAKQRKNVVWPFFNTKVCIVVELW